jgi:hypothetical protein
MFINPRSKILLDWSLSTLDYLKKNVPPQKMFGLLIPCLGREVEADPEVHREEATR